MSFIEQLNFLFLRPHLRQFVGLSENRQHAQTAGLFRLLCTIFPCNTQSIPAEKWLQQAKNPSLLVIFPVFR